MKSMSKLTAILMLVFALGLLSACSPSGAGETVSDDNGTAGVDTDELPEYDPFEGVTLKFKGVNGQGIVDLEKTVEPDNQISVEYYIDKTSSLSNGDLVTVRSFSDYPNFNEAVEEVASWGLKLTKETKQFTVEGLSEENDTDPEPVVNRDQLTPACGILHMYYYKNEEEQDCYFPDFIEIYGDGEYSFTIKRTDEEDTPNVIDGLTDMILSISEDMYNETSDIDISEAELDNIVVECDGVPLYTRYNYTLSMTDGERYTAIDCLKEPEPEVIVIGEWEPDFYDYTGVKKIVVNFTVTGTKIKEGAGINGSTLSGLGSDSDSDTGKRVFVYYDGSKNIVNSYRMLLIKVSDDREGMIKLLNEYTHMGLAAARDLYDEQKASGEVTVFYETVDPEEARWIKKAFKEAGAEVEIYSAE